MGKAQFVWNFTYIIATVLAAAILLLGVMFFTGFGKTEDNVAFFNFESSLTKSIEKQSMASFGSVSERTLSLPSSAEKVCFIDEDKEFNKLIDRGLTKLKDSYSGYNLFISPTEDYMPIKINYLMLNEGENPLCLKVIDGKIRLRLESKGSGTLVSAADVKDKEVECVSMLYNDDANNSLDIVFLGSGYKDIQSFSSDADSYIKLVKTTPPFSYALDRINFYRIDESRDIGCKAVSYGLGGYVICDDYLAKQLASECPFDIVVILINRGIIDIAQPLRSSSKGDVMTLNTAENKLVMLHELGHSFADLADEYVDSYYIDTGFDEDKYPNCDDLLCREWSTITDGCFQGCSLSAYYRPTEDSIMRSFNTKNYGPVNENETMKKLGVYKR